MFITLSFEKSLIVEQFQVNYLNIVFKFNFMQLFKVTEHSFQVSMPNPPLFVNYLCLGARFLQESRSTTEEFILPFWLKCVLLHQG